ncbi:DCC1-like thiol-disulfide oxidoreductase family protein [Flavobacteriaceae bacterium F89]|uniref:DCC1-like thiol-disulfide oxidoreductase family protein n=1 Tax=Cerina litoralis TaxID=2874477 RepID=A0AAE3EX48_9FLAO|nr:DCC1-like thiol-disulfide oxidoreductase family protein [Cerina litoralis]MCG2461351.1 DCC1-like thiol-disulfide oxidoreductase family protein [Cerina litoralis]
METQKKIILFDGVCNLCSGAVRFVVKHDRNDVFRIAPLQSVIGRKLMVDRKIDPDQTTSVVLIDPGKAYYTKSTAVLKIGREFGGIWKSLWLLERLPVGLRDWIYNLLAKNRYRWFGKKEECMVPGPKLKTKFLGEVNLDKGRV